MKKLLTNITILILQIIAFPELPFAQTTPLLNAKNEILTKELESLRKNNNVTADSAWTILSNWDRYPDIKETGRNYLFLYEDSIFGTVPLKIFIPKNYRKDIASPAVLILHGAVVLAVLKMLIKTQLQTKTSSFLFLKKKISSL